MNPQDVAIGAGFLLVGGLGTVSAYHMSRSILATSKATSLKLGEIHEMVNSNLSEVKKQLVISSSALAAANLELAGARKDIEFLKKQMADIGIHPVGERRKTRPTLNRRRKSGRV